jgi:hypothetical protein
MDPYMNALGEGFGNALETGQQDYGDIMSGLRGLAGGRGNVYAGNVSYDDTFDEANNKFRDFSNTGGYDIPNNDAYQGYKGFANTGGYSANDIADLRARGVAPIRAAYANAQKDVSRQRALQGGYSPNATAVLAKMAREQGQSGADALQNVNAGIVDSRNRNQLSGMAGMAGIDTNRIGNMMAGTTGMSNIANSRMQGSLEASKANASNQLQAGQLNQGNMLDAYKTMGSLYGTTPGMANMFGDQLGRAIQNSGAQGTSYISGENAAQVQPGQYENTKGYVNDAMTYASPFLDYLKKKPAATTGGTTYTPQQGGYKLPTFGGTF